MGNVTKIGASAFNGCTTLSLSTLPATVQEIGTLAFCNCKNNLTEFTIPASVTKFADRVFLGCEALQKVTFDTSCQLDTLPAYTFQNCYNLKKYMLAPTMKLIEEGAFMNCRSLDMVKIPEHIMRIKEKAFIGCSGITQVVIPESVKALGGQAFKGCSKIRYVIMDDTTPPSALKTLFDDDVYSKDTLYVPTGAKETYKNGEEPWKLFKNIIERKEYTVTYMVDDKPFDNPDNPKSYQTGETIVPIKEDVVRATKPGRNFSGWRNVPAYQTMPDEDVTITGIFKYAIIYKEKDTEEVLYKDSLWYGDQVVAPAKLDSAGYIYQLTPKLETMPDEDVTVTVKYLQSETEQTIDGIRYYIYTQGETAHAEIMPGQTHYTNKTITIPRSIPYQDNSFDVTVIRNDAFKDCKNLSEVHFESPSNIQQIGSQAFFNCNKLTDIDDIPQSVTELGDEAFRYCTSLTDVKFEGGLNLNLLPANIFRNCSALTNIILPSSLTTIAYDAFNGCEKLTSIIIPVNVSNIGLRAFQGCTKLETISVLNTSMPEADENTFDDLNYTDATLMVPNSVDVDNLPEPWNSFTQKTNGSSSSEPCAAPTISYDKGVLTYACTKPSDATITSVITVTDAKKSIGNVVKLEKVYTIKATARAEGKGYSKSQPTIATITWRNGKPEFNGFTSVELEASNPMKGDVNEDGKVDTQDAIQVVKIYLKKE